MKKMVLALGVLVLGLSPSLAVTKAGDLGVGVVAGDVTGPTVNIFTSRTTSIDFGIGFESDMELYADYIWHSWSLFPKPAQGVFGGYLGVGPRFKDRDDDNGRRRGDDGDDQFGVRTIGGLDYWVSGAPLQIFVEVGPWFVISPDTDTEFDAGIGVRYYFQGQRRP